MSDNIFVDTNILIYSIADDLRKRAIAGDLLLNHNIVVSTQVISEFIAVALRKQILEPPNVIEYAKQFMQAFQVVLVTNTTITSALDMMVKYRLAYWDSLILAATLENACPVIYSEDLQDGQQIENRLTIINPFA